MATDGQGKSARAPNDNVDYSLYLVTDSTMIPESSTFIKQVQEAVDSGVTLVQLREKSLSTLEFVKRAEEVHSITKKKGIPLIINDRIDVALAIDAEGVHVGQDDMPAELARKLLGPNKILGVTCSNPEEVDVVVKQKVADYVGLGTVYKTNTKKNVSDPEGTGPIGIRKMLRVLGDYNKEADYKIKCVAIGGINHSNADKVLYQCQVTEQKLDGVAVVSCIMASADARKATLDLAKIIASEPAFSITTRLSESNLDSFLKRHGIKTLGQVQPLVHHITNNVVKNFSANVTLSIGASPIMSELAEEFDELVGNAKHIALVLNLGTPSLDMMSVFKQAIQVYNKYGKHIIFDPVACGATKARLECARILLNTGHVSVIKGNVGEIMSVWKLTTFYIAKSVGESNTMRGVDSIFNLLEHILLERARQVALEFKTVVVVTGKKNFTVSPTGIVRSCLGGSPLMGKITGTGCSLGSTIAAFLAAGADGELEQDSTCVFDAATIAVEMYNSAGKQAAVSVSTPGSFSTKFLDHLSRGQDLIPTLFSRP